MKRIPVILFMLTVFVRSSGQEGNRFLEMSEKTKTEYRFELMEYTDEVSVYDVRKLQSEVKQLDEFRSACKDKEWQEIIKWLQIALDAIILSKDSNAINCDYNDIYDRLEELHTRTGNTYTRLKALRLIASICWDGLYNYESGFEYSIQLCKTVEDMPDSCFPDKAISYLELAERYYYFKEYDEAIACFDKVIGAIETPYVYNQKNILSAYNGLGLSYRNKYDIQMSNVYFNKILAFESDLDASLQDLWHGIARGNLGYNLYLTGKYDEAIPLLEFSLKKTSQYHDFAYASGPAINLADIYLKKGMLDKAHDYGVIAYDYEQKMSRTGRLESIYIFWNKYYTTVNNASKALLYLDSALNEQKKDEDRFNANQLLRVEQRIHLFEQQNKDKEIETARKQAGIYLRNFIFVTLFSVITFILLLFIYNLYRKKRTAYSALVLKSQQWANERPQIQPKQEDVIHGAEEGNLLKQVYHLLENEKVYKDNTLSLQKLAELLRTNRSYLSKAINSMTGTNFISFINEYRVKEAVKLLSDSKFDHWSIDYLAGEVGFTNRFTFSLVFKKSVGMTPTEFKKSRKKQS